VTSIKLKLSNCEHVNFLWADLLNNIGVEKANQAISQALDLQKMRGGFGTLPVLFTKTGGIALTTYEFLRQETGFSQQGEQTVLLYHPQSCCIQLINASK